MGFDFDEVRGRPSEKGTHGFVGMKDLEERNRWFVIRTKPRHEALAEANLRRQGFTVFIPKTQKSVKHARRTEVRKVQLFPGYGFVELDPSRDPWRSIGSTVGVHQLIMARERPMPVPPGVVEGFLASSDADGVVNLVCGLKTGCSVRVRAGPLSGTIGLLTELDDKGRVEVLLRIMSGEVRVKMAQGLLEAYALHDPS